MSNNDFILEAKPREDVGKGASRRLRRLADEIPAIIYGAGKEPRSITLAHDALLHAVENEAFFSHIITINVGKDKEDVVIKDLQRHPARARLMHADFMRVSKNQPITVNVPLHFVNEDKCIGVKQEGGIVSHLLNELEVSCLPADLPEYIEVYMAELKVGESIHIADLALPEGVTSIDLSHGEENNLAVVSVVMPRAAVEEETEAPEAPEEPGEVGAEPEENGDDE